MADINGRNPGDPGYDFSTDYDRGGSPPEDWFDANPPPPATSVSTPLQPGDPGYVPPGTFIPNLPHGPSDPIDGVGTSLPPGATGYTDPLQFLSVQLGMHPDNPQAAIDAFFAQFPGDTTIAPKWYPDTKTIGLANGTYLVAPHSGANNAETWFTVTRTPEGGSGSGSGSGSGGGFGELLTPFPGVAPTYAPVRTDYPDFKLPTVADMLVDPGYEFRMKEGERALTNSAAGRGELRTGGTLKDFLSFGQDMASQEYGNVVNRNLAEYNANLGTFNTNNQGVTTNNDALYKRFMDQYDMYRNRQRDTYDYLSGTTHTGLDAARS